MSVPRVTRKTEKGLPRYDGSDIFVLSGAEDLVPVLNPAVDPGTGVLNWVPVPPVSRGHYEITRWRPRTEGLFARIERWERNAGPAAGDVHWRATTRENVTSIYGRTEAARIIDPAASTPPERRRRVYEWLLQETYDARGNHILYEYALEDGPGPDEVSELRRRHTQLYIRRILYGNSRQPIGPKRAGTDHRVLPDPSNGLGGFPAIDRHYLLEVVFDYVEVSDPASYPVAPSTQERTSAAPAAWPVRPDPFSSYRSGFEVRTVRRCEGLRLFHHFEELGDRELVRAARFDYEAEADAQLSLLRAVTLLGYRWDEAAGEWRERAMPPVTFDYSRFEPSSRRYRSLEARGGDLPAAALGRADLTLVDLYADGLPGVLEGSAGRFRYWRNLGDGQLDRPHPLHHAPQGLSLSTPGVRLADMDGDGRLELVVQNGSQSGFYESTGDGAWQSFRRYRQMPAVDLSDPNVRLLDLTGDGRTDALLTLDHHFLWYEGRGEDGFVEGGVIERQHDLDAFPNVYFGDPSGRVRLADMSGDGLSDIVWIHEGAVDYWPNLGYGRFGHRVRMSRVPDAPDLAYDFDPGRLFLVDLNGSGCADLVYVEHDRVHFWINHGGNDWSERRVIHGTPPAVDSASIQFADVFGTGTATLLWSYEYGAFPGGNYKALDLCGGVKPYVLTEMSNNLGATTRVRYGSSTRFAIDDASNGEPWATRLPFPVQVLEQVETIDHIGRTKLTTRYRYHHGYFDGEEREFRGFGRVDQYDTEEFETFAGAGLHGADTAFTNGVREYHAPPTLTKSWFHTGAHDEAGGTLQARYAREFWAGDPAAFNLDDHTVQDGSRQAYRALRGSLIRSEMFALDGTDRADHPYTVTDKRYRVRRLQPPHDGARGVYLTSPREVLTHHYEREPSDPRVSHEITAEVDDWGNVTKSLAIAYPRRGSPPHEEQKALAVVFNAARFINTPELGPDPGCHYVGVGCEQRAYELADVAAVWPGDRPLRISDLPSTASDPDDYVPFHEEPAGVGKRLLKWTRTYFRGDVDADQLDPRGQLDHRLPLGGIESLGLPYEEYRAAFTDDQLDMLTGGRAQLADMPAEGGYHREPAVSKYWWVPSGRSSYLPDRFHVPHRTLDAFGAETSVGHDRYDIVIEEAVDRRGNRTAAENDYRVLQPRRLTDPNGTETAVAFDALGLVVATAVTGPGGEGDSLAGVDPDPPLATVRAHLDDPLDDPRPLMGEATTRMVYDLRRYHELGDVTQPAAVATIAREVHVSDEGGTPSRLQQRVLYSDGFGREAQTKVLVEKGPLSQGPGEPDVAPRWLGSGWTIYNNKGEPVRKYEPFFSDTSAFEYAEVRGVSPVLFYDPVGRVVATLKPDHGYQKVVFDAWSQATWDANDTVRLDPRTDPDLSIAADFLADLPASWETWLQGRIPASIDPSSPPAERQRGPALDAAVKAWAHGGTPAVAHLDPQGRPFLTVTDNGPGESYATRIAIDVEGNDLRVTDPRGVEAFVHGFDMLQRKLRVDSRDAGPRSFLPDVAGDPVHAWDARDTHVRTRYDALRRPTEVWARPASAPRPRLVSKTLYGEDRPQAQQSGFRERVWRVYDGGGLLEHEAYDFRGSLRRSSRRLAADGQESPDWDDLAVAGLSVAEIQQRADPKLEAAIHATAANYDALRRVIDSTAPDGSVVRPIYNQRGLLHSLTVDVEGEAGTRTFVEAMGYDQKGQRTRIQYGNQAETTYEYDPNTFRLLSATSRRSSGFLLQDLEYAYDAVGNITRLTDGRCEPVYNGNQQIGALGGYTYDPLYRLIRATGREHQGASPCAYQDRTNKRTAFQKPIQPIENCQALRLYTRHYRYDAAGNLEEIKHLANGGQWTRTQRYDEDPAGSPRSNRLASSRAGCPGEAALDPVPHDANGNILALARIEDLAWDHADRLVSATLGPPHNGTPHQVFFQYDTAGTRVRKIEVKGNERFERIYLGGYELYRRHTNAGVAETRQTLHVMDDQRRIVLVEKRDPGSADRELRFRYQLGDHLDSARIELDEHGGVISYEEFYPYGGTAYLAGDNEVEAKKKRYRYGGKERDDETGLYYYGARYYVPWMGRWLSPDPAGAVDGPNLFAFVRGNPLRLLDPEGTDAIDAIKSEFNIEVKDNLTIRLQQTNLEGRQLELEGKLGEVESRLGDTPWDRDLNRQQSSLQANLDQVEGEISALERKIEASDTRIKRLLKKAEFNLAGRLGIVGQKAKKAAVMAEIHATHLDFEETKHDLLSAKAGQVIDEDAFLKRLRQLKVDPELAGRVASKILPFLQYAAKFGRWLGPAGMAFSGAVDAHQVDAQPPEQQPRRASEVAGKLVLGEAGAVAGGVAGGATVVGVAALLGISGPPGWIIAAGAIVGGGAGGYLASEAGESAGGLLFDWLAGDEPAEVNPATPQLR